VADRFRSAPASFRQQLPDALATPDQIDRLQDGVSVAKAQPRFVEEAAFDALHRKRNRAAAADGVDAELVATPYGAQDRVSIADTAERAERKQALVFQAHLDGGWWWFVGRGGGRLVRPADRVNVLTADRARDAACSRPRMRDGELLRRNGRGFVERAALKVAGRQRAEPIERQEIGRRSELAVLGGGRTERSPRQVATELGDLARLRPLAAVRPADRDRLDVLAAEDGAAATATGMTAVMRDRRVTDSPFPRRTDRRNPIIRAVACAQLLFRHRTRIATDVVGRVEPRVAVVDNENRQRRCTTHDHDRVTPTAFAGEREAAARKRIIESPGQRAAADDGEFGGCGERDCRRAD
jgi:hypothetical protein